MLRSAMISTFTAAILAATPAGAAFANAPAASLDLRRYAHRSTNGLRIIIAQVFGCHV